MTDIVWPEVVVMLVTYNRPSEFRYTFGALYHHLKYSGPLRWVICDDGSENIRATIDAINIRFPDVQFQLSETNRKGWGANVNAGVRQFAPDSYVYVNEDDFVAQRDINLDTAVMVLEKEQDIGIIRYDGIAYIDLTLDVRYCETPIGILSYLRIRRESMSLYIYGNRPHLKHPRFRQIYGDYREGLKIGQTEEDMCWRIKNWDTKRKGPSPDIACLSDMLYTPYDHIGKTWQLTKDDVGVLI